MCYLTFYVSATMVLNPRFGKELELIYFVFMLSVSE